MDTAIVDVGTFLLGLATAFWVIFRLGKTETVSSNFFICYSFPSFGLPIRAGFEGAAFAIFVLHRGACRDYEIRGLPRPQISWRFSRSCWLW